MLWFAPPSVGQEAQGDSLVWYIEALEYDLSICKIDGKARADSLAIRLEFVNERLEWALDDRPKFYQHPTLWFLVGAGLGVLVAGMALKVAS